jgi:uncharacterized protein (TIGR02145 family)
MKSYSLKLGVLAIYFLGIIPVYSQIDAKNKNLYEVNSVHNHYNPNTASNNPDVDTIYDRRDKRYYKTVRIGDQWWMAENLAYLPKVSPPYNYSGNDYYYYVYDYMGFNAKEAKLESSYHDFGVLYNWSAAMNSCPEGWHVPTDDEWKKLEIFLGMNEEALEGIKYRGTSQGKMLKSIDGWSDDNNGTDDYGFNALPAGMRYLTGAFDYIGDFAYFWSSTDLNDRYARFRMLFGDSTGIYRNATFKEFGLSVRCVKNSSIAPEITQQPKNIRLKEGDTASFVITAINGGINYRWQKNGIFLDDDNRIAGSRSTNLIIKNLTSADAGHYHCIISNNAGLVLSKRVKLKVKNKNQ